MSQRDRGGFFKAVTALFAVLIVALLAWWIYETGTLTAVSRYEAERHAAQYAADAQESIERDCLHREPAAMAKCIREIIESTNEHQRSQNDLVAQGDMALWAFWMVIVSVAGVGITGVGVAYVALTLREARETTKAAIRGADAAIQANETTQSVAEAQARAYLSVIRADIHINRREPTVSGWTPIDVFLSLHNSGASPAVNVSYHCYSSVCMWREIEKFTPIDEVPYQQFITNVPPGENTARKIVCYGVARDWGRVLKRWESYTDQTPIGDAPILLINGVVFYEDVFGATFRSQFCFWLEDQPREGKTFKGKDDLPTIQDRVATFERIADRHDHIKRPHEDE